MNFLNPFVLLGLAAAAIPVLLHLLNLRKLKTVEFSSLKFLKELQKSKIRRLKIKQILLLILRTLIIVFAVLAFSRPVIEGNIPGFESYSKSSAVIIIDNSFSMDVSDEYGNRFTQAKKAAETIISSLHEGDEAVIIEMANTKDRRQYTFTRNIGLLRQRLNEIRIENTKANFDASLAYSSLILDDALNFSRELFVITDGQRNIFNTQDSVKFAQKNTGVYVIPIGLNSKSDIENLSIDSINVVTRIFQSGKPVEVSAQIHNHSSKDMKGVLIGLVFNKQRVAQRIIDLPAGETRTISIAAPAQQSGAISASIELETDALATDNKRYFGFIVPDNPKVAVVGNQQNRKFLELLFSGGDEAGVGISPLNPNDVSSMDLQRFDCILLAEGNYRESDFARLLQYVTRGGSLFIFANDETDPKTFDNAISQFGFGAVSAKTFGDAKPVGFTSVDKLHPLFEGVFSLDGQSNSSAESPKIMRSKAVSAGLSIIDMTNGSFLAENKIGDGKVLYCAVSPNLTWSNFPVTSLFPALLYRSVFYLSSTESLGLSAEIADGQVAVIPKKYSSNPNFKIIDPAGNEIMQQLPILPTGAVLPTADWREPGVYAVYNSQNKLVSMAAMNLPKSESYAPIKEKEELEKQLLARMDKDIKLDVISDTENLRDSIKRSRMGTELWQIFLVLAILCAAAEMIVQKASKEDLGEK